MRTGRAIFINVSEPSSRWHALAKRIARRAEAVNTNHFGMDISGGMQPLQIARYGPGEFYAVHRGQGEENPTRSLSCAILLRPVERGGGMRFPEAAERMPEQAPGDAIIFRGDEPQAAAPVEAGSRMTAVLWFQQAGER